MCCCHILLGLVLFFISSVYFRATFPASFAFIKRLVLKHQLMLECLNQHSGVALVDPLTICTLPLLDRILSFPSYDVICRVRCVHDNGRALGESKRTFQLVVENLSLSSRTLECLGMIIMEVILLILWIRKLRWRFISVRWWTEILLVMIHGWSRSMIAIVVLASLRMSIMWISLLMITLAKGIVRQWTWKTMRGRWHVCLIIDHIYAIRVILV